MKGLAELLLKKEIDMTYKEIIEDNIQNHSGANKWWPKYAFHYTDVSNAVSILNSGFLYSRMHVKEKGLMHSDNASRKVIDMTRQETMASVRFYFRPKTPTQYHNEGFKHSQLRYDNDLDANVPVPVFLLFNLEKLLSMPETKFSQFPQSGSGSKVFNTETDFMNFDFDKIYSDGPMSNPDEKKYRHAEILFPDSFKISSCLKMIICRNNIERVTLLNCLREKNKDAYNTYKSLVKVRNPDVFYNNGLFVDACTYNNNKASITFSDKNAKLTYMESQIRKSNLSKEDLQAVNAKAEFDWVRGERIIDHLEATLEINYVKGGTVVFDFTQYDSKEADLLLIKFYVENMLMCYIEQPLAEIEMI